jgi:hypothetical protein
MVDYSYTLYKVYHTINESYERGEMKRIDLLIRQAQALAPDKDSIYLLFEVTIIYQPNTDELPRSPEELKEVEEVTGLSKDMVIVKCDLYGKTSGTIKEAVPVIIRRDQLDDFLKIVRFVFPPRNNQKAVIWIPVKVDQVVITGEELVLDVIMDLVRIQEGGEKNEADGG